MFNPVFISVAMTAQPPHLHLHHHQLQAAHRRRHRPHPIQQPHISSADTNSTTTATTATATTTTTTTSPPRDEKSRDISWSRDGLKENFCIFSVLILRSDVLVLRTISRVVSLSYKSHHCGHRPVKSLWETFPD